MFQVDTSEAMNETIEEIYVISMEYPRCNPRDGRRGDRGPSHRFLSEIGAADLQRRLFICGSCKDTRPHPL